MNKKISTSTFFKIWFFNCIVFLIQTIFFNLISDIAHLESSFFDVFMIIYIFNIISGIVTFIFGLVQYIIEKNKENEKIYKNKTQKKKAIFNKAKKIFYFWLGTIALFYLLIFSVNGDFSNASFLSALIFLIDILSGILAFLILIYLIFKNKFWDLLAITFFIFLAFFIILPKLPSRNNQLNNNSLTSDPLVDCPINRLCGGGYKKLKESECVNSTCCQIGSSWIVMDKDQCKLKQEEYSQSSRNNHPIYIQPPPRIEAPKIEVPKIEAPICCKENYSPLTGQRTVKCERSWFCF